MQHRFANVVIALCGLAMILWLAGACPASAQDSGPPPPDAMGAPPDFGGVPPAMNVDKELARMVKRYSLTDVQKAQIRPILADVKQKMDAIFKDSSIEPEDRAAKIRSIHTDEVARISALLTDEQRTKYQKDEARMHEDEGPGGPDGPPPPPPDGNGGPPPPGDAD